MSGAAQSAAGAVHAPASPPSAAMRSFEAQWRARAADPLAGLREQAMARFMRLGLPTTHDESWRYTNLRSLAHESYADAPRALLAGAAEAASSLGGLGHDARLATLLLVNGAPAQLEAPDHAINGIEINSLRTLLNVNPTLVSDPLSSLSDAEELRWALLNTALFSDGLHIRIHGAAAAPLRLLHVACGRGANDASYPLVIIQVDAGSNATILEHHVSSGSEALLCNSATHIALSPGAQLEHYRVFATHARASHFDTLAIRQDQDSRCRQFTMVMGGGLVRANLDSHLEGAGSALESRSLLVGHDSRHVDCVNVARHVARRTSSRQISRSIASGTSRVIFNSKVVVEAGAANADSQQSCRGLLLSPSAEIDSRPQLEIHTNEVKCSHGATTGRLDPDMLFYMLSRGLDRETAQSLLVFAFLADALTGMSVSQARADIESALIAQLPDSHALQELR